MYFSRTIRYAQTRNVARRIADGLTVTFDVGV
jgi:hypothetical protein